jgi:hypothetical protein
MMQPDFSNMTDRELKDYALAHRENDEVFEELIKRVEMKAKSHPYPETEEGLIAKERAFMQSISKSRA